MAVFAQDTNPRSSGGSGPAEQELMRALNARGVQLSPGAGVPAGEPRVYMGRQRRTRPTASGERDFLSGISAGRFSQDRVVSLDEAALQFNRMTTEQQKAFAERLVAEGLLPADYTYEDVKNAWIQFVKEAADFYAAGKKVTPWDVIGLYAGAPGKGGFAREEQQYPYTQTQTSVTLTDAVTARAMLTQMLTSELGRAASEEEVDDFVTALHGAQQANPTVTTTTFSDENTASTTTEGGVDAGAFTQDFARGERFSTEAGSYQAVSTYFPALLEAIGPVV